jgi:hypothetical protein
MLFANQWVTRLLERHAERSTGRTSGWWHRVAASPRALDAGLLSAGRWSGDAIRPSSV